jgi:hypothetical protein
MKSKNPFPSLDHWAETRETLHAYAMVLGAIRSAFSPELPRYQHVSLRLYTSGLTTTPIPHPADPKRSFALSLDLRNHYVLLSTSEGDVQQWRMSEGLSAHELGTQLLAKLAEIGVSGNVDPKKYADEKERTYSLDAAERYFTALSSAGRALEDFRSGIKAEVDPLQFWPHHFDLAFVVLGKKSVQTKEGEFPSQLTIGFSPEDASQTSPYFYVNPFPFDDAILGEALPSGASWHTASWKGAMLPYGELADAADAEQKLKAFLQASYEIEKSVL